MSDLAEKVVWLRDHDDTARQVGKNGQALAWSLTFQAELKAAGKTIAAAVKYVAEQPEFELQSGTDARHHVRLVAGWAVPGKDGLPMSGTESRLELPRPIASESFVIILDLSPDVGAPAQRVVVAVNGEVLCETVVSNRRLLCCRVAQQTIEAAERLTITLLHPDSISLASESYPLDDREVSMILHSVTLSPTNSLPRVAGTTAETVSPEPVRPTRKPFRETLYGPDLLLPPESRLGRLKTNRGTVVFADVESGTLRHGPDASSPKNVILADDKSTAYLLYLAPDGERYSVGVSPERRDADGGSRAGAQAYHVISIGADGHLGFGLQSCGLLLCAETDGRVTLSRNVLGPWEWFELVEPCQAIGAITTTPQTNQNSSSQSEHITVTGANPEARSSVKIQSAFDKAMICDGKLPEAILTMNGMSGRKARYFLNNLIESLDDARYLEIGVWQGSTLCSAIYGNQVNAVAIDNWSQFGGPVDEFMANLAEFRGPNAKVIVLETDFRAAPFDTLGEHNVYTYDGPHLKVDQYDGIALALPALGEEFILIVDDWNWRAVREGTLDAIATLKLTVDLQIEVKTTLDDTHVAGLTRQHSDWHNGYFVAALRKPPRISPMKLSEPRAIL